MGKFRIAFVAIVASLCGMAVAAQTPDGESVGDARAYLVEFPKPDRYYARLGEVGPYYPDKAVRAGVNGAAVIECDVGLERELTACTVVGVQPKDWGFEHAALRMAERRYVIAPMEPDMPKRAAFAIRFQMKRSARP